MSIFYDFEVADISPYTHPDLTYFGTGRFQVSGLELIADTGISARTYLRYSATEVTDDVIRSTVVVDDASSDSPNTRRGPAIIDSSGNGYTLQLSSNVAYVRAVTAGADDGWFPDALFTGYAAGDEIELEYQVSTGRLEAFWNGTSVKSYSSTKYTTGLSPAVCEFNVASRTKGFRSFSSTITVATGPDYTARKGSTATITHTLTADGITTATLDGETVTIGTQSGQDADIDLDETAITTSGVYDLVLGDGVGTETFTVQYNVIGLTTNTIQKDGASIGAQTDVEMHILDATGATVLGNLTGLTTDASGITGQTIVPAGAVDDSVRVIGYSDAAEIGFAYKTTLGLL